MESLLQITTIPIEYDLNIQSPRLEYSSDKVSLNMKTEKGGLTIENHPTKLQIDTYEARSSICPTTMESVRQAAVKGKNAVYEYMQQTTEEGKILLDPYVQNPLDQVISQRAEPKNGKLVLSFLPSTGPDIEWSTPDLDIQYETDKLSFDLKVANGNFEFIPGDVEVTITQMPDVQIDYVGDPIYVPPSSANLFNRTSFNVLA